MKSFKIEALILCIGLCIGMFVMGKFVNKGLATDRVVTVKGLSEREVKANKVIWPLILKEVNNDLNDLYAVMTHKNKAVIDFLKKKGIDESEISVGALQVIDKVADAYNPREVSFRYKATSPITITSNKVDLVREIIQSQSELLKVGIAVVTEEYGANQIRYEFTELNSIKPDMIEESTKNARATAEKFAKDSNSHLGNIRRASQGQFTISDRDNATPYIKNIRVVSTIEYSIED